MPRSARAVFATVRTEGAILPQETLRLVAELSSELPGLTPESYGLSGRKLNEAINQSWTVARAAWKAFRSLPIVEGDTGKVDTWKRWLGPLFQELGHGALEPLKESVDAGGKRFAIAFMSGCFPVHAVGFRVELGTRSAGVAGAARASPHGLVQEFLNREPRSLWGVVTNGLSLRLLRDNVSLTRQAYVEFDLQAMMDGEVYPDFALLWLLLHSSRVKADRPEDCWLEVWSRAAVAQGTRAFASLRGGVQKAIEALGRGILAAKAPANAELAVRLRNHGLEIGEFNRQLLRLVYRLLFLFVSEDREALLAPDASAEAKAIFHEHYSTWRLRRLAQRLRGTEHGDLWAGLKILMGRLGADEPTPELGLAPLGSFLWSERAVADVLPCEIRNRDLLEAVRALAFTAEGKVLRPVDYRNLGAEELGSVYESLLELHPELDTEAATFTLVSVAGSDKKTSGSYYTPTSLVQSLLDSALDPALDQAARRQDAEKAILSLKVVDPSCGSGHFLIAAAHRIAKRLAYVRTHDLEPSPEATRHALRDVIGHCIHGVDLNEMAVELCKVSLWLEALEPGKPLSFLETKIQHGNALIGATPVLIGAGIPDGAFVKLEGDSDDTIAELRKKNRAERDAGQMVLGVAAGEPSALAKQAQDIEDLDHDSLDGVHQKERAFGALKASAEYKRESFAADAFCAAFFWRKGPSAPPAVTTSLLEAIRTGVGLVPPRTADEVRRLAGGNAFFHWHLAFPSVFRAPGPGGKAESPDEGWSGGFDVILGNPPWERVKLQEKEWFASRRPEIAAAENAAQRRKLIEALRESAPRLYEEFVDARRGAEAESQFIRTSGRYPLCGRGDVNTYAVFSELNISLAGRAGRVGCIVPSGVATDDTTKLFFQHLMENKFLERFMSFENEDLVFPAVHHAMRFALVTLSKSRVEEANFVFFARQVSDLADPNRHFTLSNDDIRLLCPNTRTCPTFRSKLDAELNKAIHRRVPVLVDEGAGVGSPWGAAFGRLFDMANDSHLFRDEATLRAEGWGLKGNFFELSGRRYLPLYEAKMVHQFDHRFGTYDGQTEAQSRQGILPRLSEEEHQDTTKCTQPYYWVPQEEVEKALAGSWEKGWILGWRDICRSTDQRTLIASTLPRGGAGDQFLLLFPRRAPELAFVLLANLNAFVLDFAARQKVGGTHLKYFTMRQLPILPPEAYSAPVPWAPRQLLSDWLRPRVMELVFTSSDMESFARDSGFEGPPFRWDEARRAIVRAELDAAYFHLYGLRKEDVAYVLETFPIVHREDEKRFGQPRTKTLILDAFERMNEAAKDGKTFRTSLVQPPDDVAVAHQSRGKGTSTPAILTAASLADLLRSARVGSWRRTPDGDAENRAWLAIAAAVRALGSGFTALEAHDVSFLVEHPAMVTKALPPDLRADWVRAVGDEAVREPTLPLVDPFPDGAWERAWSRVTGGSGLLREEAGGRWAVPDPSAFEAPPGVLGRAAAALEVVRRLGPTEVRATIHRFPSQEAARGKTEGGVARKKSTGA